MIKEIKITKEESRKYSFSLIVEWRSHSGKKLETMLSHTGLATLLALILFALHLGRPSAITKSHAPSLSEKAAKLELQPLSPRDVIMYVLSSAQTAQHRVVEGQLDSGWPALLSTAGRFVVVVEDSAEAEAWLATLDCSPTHYYEWARKGWSFPNASDPDTWFDTPALRGYARCRSVNTQLVLHACGASFSPTPRHFAILC